jgi:hypothetical protein
MKHLLLIVLLFSSLILITGTNCKKNNPEAGLPPATQEGKNTCGFLVNGKVWTPRGDNGYPNLSCSYDETYNGGTFGINGYRYEAGARNSSGFAVGGNNIKSAGNYKLNISPSLIGIYNSASENCWIYEWNDTIPNHNAYLNITKLDKINHIISGTFEFTLSRTGLGCETIHITKGRFDMRY